MSAETLPARERYWHVDWLRVIALGLLLVYHVLCVFDSRVWVLKSAYAGPWADGLVALLTPWRMSLVFFIGGVASAFLLRRAEPGGFIRDRFARLIVPFVFAVIVLIPPQEYAWRNAFGLATESYWRFWLKDAWTLVNYHGLRMPNVEHVWFLPYLFLYGVATALLWKPAHLFWEWARRRLDAAPLWALTLAVMVWFVFVDAIVSPVRARSIFILGDITGHLRFAPVYMLGVVLARSDAFWSGVVKARKPLGLAAIILAIAALAVLHAMGPGVASPRDFTLNAVRAAFGGAMLFALLGWGAYALNKPSPILSYLSDAILPVYLLHQTFLIVFGYAVGANAWPVWQEAFALLAVSTIAPLAVYQCLIRHTRWLRVLFGLRQNLRPMSAPAAAQAVEIA